MLKEDHKKVEQLFKRFESAGERAHVEKRNIVDRIIEELSAAVEEQLFYPVVRATVPGTEHVTLESLEEHNIVKWVLSDLDSMSPEDERFDAKVTVLIENVRHHVEEEESELFPKVRDELGRAASAIWATPWPRPRRPPRPTRIPARPTRPRQHRRGAAAGVADRIGDTVSGLAQVACRCSPTSSPPCCAARSRARRRRDRRWPVAPPSGCDPAPPTPPRRPSRPPATRSAPASAVRTTRATAPSAQTGAKRTARAAKRAAPPRRGRSSLGRRARPRRPGAPPSGRRPPPSGPPPPHVARPAGGQGHGVDGQALGQADRADGHVLALTRPRSR